MEAILKMLLFFFSNSDIDFSEARKRTWRNYTTVEALPIIHQIEFIDKKKSTKVVLDENLKTFIVHIVMLEVIKIHLLSNNCIAACQDSY